MAKPLENTLNALKSQSTEFTFETIVVDDASEDNTKQVVSQFPDVSYVHYGQHPQKQRRVAEIRNIGARKAMGRVLIFLDADMIPRDDFVFQHIQSHDKVDIVLGLRYNQDAKGRIKHNLDSREPYFVICDNQVNTLPAPWALLYSHNFSVKKQIFRSVGGFSTYFDCWGVEDQELGYKLYKRGVNFYLNKKIVAEHQYHAAEYRSKLQKKTKLVRSSKKFFSRYSDPGITAFYGLVRKALRVDLSDVCNNNCGLCSSLDRKGEHIKKDDLFSALDSMDKDWKLILSGGEPCLRQDFWEILLKFKALGFHNLELATNGRALYYQSFCRRCTLAGIANYEVTVFGHNARLHDSITKVPGSFKQTVQGIYNLVNLRQGVAIHVVINETNHRFLGQIIRFIHRFGIEDIFLSLVPDDKNKLQVFRETSRKIRMHMKKGLVFRNTFYRCFQDYLHGNNELTIQKMRGCTQCIFLNECRGKPGEFFARI